MTNKRIPLWRRRWWQILVSGLVLFYILAWSLDDTRNPSLVPSLLLLGAFLVPVVFLTYLGERLPVRDIPLSAVVVCFLWGGAVGVTLAGFLEYTTLRDLGFLPLVGVGLIEESVKLLLPLVFFVRGRYRTEAHGLLFGVAAGMGFAALETMGYGFVAFIESRGDLGTLELTLLVRGLMSPAGHAAWTGLVCATLWRERERSGHAVVNFAVVSSFLAAVILHALWDTFTFLPKHTQIPLLEIAIGSLAIAALSLALLLQRVDEAGRDPHSTSSMLLRAASNSS